MGVQEWRESVCVCEGGGGWLGVVRNWSRALGECITSKRRVPVAFRAWEAEGAQSSVGWG